MYLSIGFDPLWWKLLSTTLPIFLLKTTLQNRLKLKNEGFVYCRRFCLKLFGLQAAPNTLEKFGFVGKSDDLSRVSV